MAYGFRMFGKPIGVLLDPISDIKYSCLKKVQLLAESQSIQRLVG